MPKEKGSTSKGHPAAYEPESVDDLIDSLWQEEEGEAPVYRGQRRASWPCNSSLQRVLLVARNADSLSAGWAEWEQYALSWFRAHGRVYMSSPPDDDDLLSWLIAMQHHGAPTRLLDWSESPFVALYFAYRNMRSDETEPAMLYRLGASQARSFTDPDLGFRGRDDFRRRRLTFTSYDAAGEKIIEKRRPGPGDPSWQERENQIIREHILSKSALPLPVVPAYPDRQMIAQQTVLTVVGSLTEPLEPNNRIAGYDLSRTLCDSKWRYQILRVLRTMGITESTLFPTLGGLGRETRMLLEQSAIPARLDFESKWLRREDDNDPNFEEHDI